MSESIEKVNPFGETQVTIPAASEPVSVAMAAQAEAMIKARLCVAMGRPRNESQAYALVMAAMERPTMANKAAYRYPRGGSNISGPSVYLAREMARLWGNIDHGVQVISDDGREVHIRATAWDLQTNTSVSSDAKFKKLVQRKQGGETRWVTPDDRDLRELIGKQGAIAVRNCILQIIPSDMIEDALDAALETQRAITNGELQKDRKTYINTIAKYFMTVGVTVPMIEAYLKHPLDMITKDEAADLKQILNSIDEGNSSPAEYFTMNSGEGEPKKGVEGLKQTIKKKGKSAEKEPEPGQEEINLDDDEPFKG